MNSFEGGLFLDKKSSENTQVLDFAPERIELSLSAEKTHVNSGEYVKIGQLLASGPVNVYSTISGIVESADSERIRIKNDFSNQTIEHETIDTSDAGRLESEYLLGLLKKYSILGMGGAQFPAYKKYSTKKKIDTIVINGCECEPFLTCDYALMRDKSEMVILGARLFQKIVGAQRVVLCIEEHSRKVAENFGSIEVMIFQDRYPQGSEKMIVSAGFEKEIPFRGFPDDIGIIVSNAATCYTFAVSVLSGLPPVSRIVTVAGNVGRPCNVRSPFGTSVGDIISFCGGMNTGSTVIVGGPMTGKRITELSFPITYGTNGIIVLKADDHKQSPCIRCGGCVRVCPSDLTPFRIEEGYLSGRYDLCSLLGVHQCISCGCCSYVCPAKRNLSYHISLAKQRGKKQ